MTGSHSKKLDPFVAVSYYQSIINTIAPVLKPQIIPRGYSYDLDILLKLCKTKQQRQDLDQYIETKRPQSKINEHDIVYPEIIGEYDLSARVYRVKSIQWMTKKDQFIHQYNQFMELQLQNTSKTTMSIITHFLLVNGHEKDDIQVFQQCFNAIFALDTIYRALPSFPIVIGMNSIDPVQMTSSTDIKELLDPLFNVKKQLKKQKNKDVEKIKSMMKQTKLKRQKMSH